MLTQTREGFYAKFEMTKNQFKNIRKTKKKNSLCTKYVIVQFKFLQHPF